MSEICSATLRGVPGSPLCVGVAAPLAPGLLSLRDRPNRLLELNPKLRVSAVPFPIKYAAVCKAVAAADLLARWLLAFCNFVFQSGLTRSVVMTVEAFAEIEVVRLLCAFGTRLGLAEELIEEEDDIADEKLPRFVALA